MTIKSNNAFSKFVCLGGETDFYFSFPIFNKKHLVVEKIKSSGSKKRLVLFDDFSIDEGFNEQGGEITLNEPAEKGDCINLYRCVEIERLTDFSHSMGLNISQLNMELDLFIQMLQNIQRDVNRSVKAEFGEDFSSLLSSIYKARDDAEQSQKSIFNTENECDALKKETATIKEETALLLQEKISIIENLIKTAETHSENARLATDTKANKTLDNLPSGYDYIVEAWPTLADIQSGKADGSKWYEIYKSGKMKMGGRITINSDGLVWIAFPKSFKYAPINVFTSPYNQSTNSTSDHNFLSFPLGITKDGFNFKYFDSDGSSWRRGPVSWSAEGF